MILVTILVGFAITVVVWQLLRLEERVVALEKASRRGCVQFPKRVSWSDSVDEDEDIDDAGEAVVPKEREEEKERSEREEEKQPGETQVEEQEEEEQEEEEQEEAPPA